MSVAKLIMLRPGAGALRRIGCRSMRYSSTLRLLQPRGGTSDKTPTVYCTGFLTDTSDVENYRDWLSVRA